MDKYTFRIEIIMLLLLGSGGGGGTAGDFSLRKRWKSENGSFAYTQSIRPIDSSCFDSKHTDPRSPQSRRQTWTFHSTAKMGKRPFRRRFFFRKRFSSAVSALKSTHTPISRFGEWAHRMVCAWMRCKIETICRMVNYVYAVCTQPATTLWRRRSTTTTTHTISM